MKHQIQMTASLPNVVALLALVPHHQALPAAAMGRESPPAQSCDRCWHFALHLQPPRSARIDASLARTLASDMAAGAVAAGLSAPLVFAMDRAMTLNAAGESSVPAALNESLSEFAISPVAFVTSEPFQWIWFACGVTYAAANALKSLAVPPLLLLLATTGVNTVACILKDARFAQLYGKERSDGGTRRPLPRSSFACFFARDMVTMAFVFIAPSLVLNRLPNLPAPVCRFGTPLLCQYFTAPLYLLGLAFYNLPGSPLHAQIVTVRNAYAATVSTRQVHASCHLPVLAHLLTHLQGPQPY